MPPGQRQRGSSTGGPSVWGRGALRKLLPPEYMDVHPHLPSEAEAATTTTGGCAHRETARSVFPSLRVLYLIPSQRPRPDAMACTACHPPTPHNTHSGKTAHGGRTHLW